jgi:hypothetical protein
MHNIDSAMNSLWDFYKKNFLPLFITALVMSIVIHFTLNLVNMKDFAMTTDPLIFLEKIKGLLVPILLISLINFLFTIILHYYVIHNPVDRSTTIFVSIVKSLKYFIPYFIMMVLLAFVGTIAMVLGVFVLIIGVFFAVLYIVTLYLFILPIMIVEGINIGSIITRTFSLTHKNFWSNIGWVAVFIILMLVVSVILSSIIYLPFTGSFLKTLFHPENTNLVEINTKPAFIILSSIVSALTFPVMPIFACILYFNGKAREEQIQKSTPIEPDNKVRVEDLYAKPYSDEHPDNPDKKE